MTGGAAVGDFDNDGWTDLFYPRMDDYCILYRNRGFGRGFEDVTLESGLPFYPADRIRCNTGVWTDLDGDGDLVRVEPSGRVARFRVSQVLSRFLASPGSVHLVPHFFFLLCFHLVEPRICTCRRWQRTASSRS